MTEKYDWTKLVCGGDSFVSIYDEAVLEGMIKPEKVTFSRFKSKLRNQTTIEVHPGILEERQKMSTEVANIMRRRSGNH